MSAHTQDARGGSVRSNEGSIAGLNDLRLAYRTWEVPRPRAAVLLVHGLGEHSGRYDGFARSLAGSAISTYALDLRGHGMSEGRRGHTPSFDTLLQEVDRFRREVEGLVPFRLPLILLGQSFGGLLCLRYLEEYSGRFRAAVICSPWLATALPVPRWKVMLANTIHRALPALPFRSPLRPEDLTHETELVQAYRDDPLVHFTITPRLFVEVAAAMGIVLQRSDRIREPVLFVLGGADRIVDTERTLRFARSMPGDVTVRVHEDHFHEPLQELDRTRVYREIRDWIAARL